MSIDQEVVIVSACRTPIGKLMGSLSTLGPGKLGSLVVGESLKRAGISANLVDEVIMGNVLSAGWGQGIARQAAIGAGIPISTPSFGVNKVCGSGLKSIILAAQSIRLGDAEVVIAGGTESMSTAPHLLKGIRQGKKLGNLSTQDSLIHDGLTDVFENVHMGITAENIASSYKISRQEQDEFALQSQQRVREAEQTGRFKEEITSVEVTLRKGATMVFEKDEHPRPDTTLDDLSRLKPAFKPDGTVTAGNASGVNDGAAALVVMSKQRARQMGLAPLAVIKAYASAGVEPSQMGLGPIPATKKALQKAGLSTQDIELIEINEAFASQSIAVIRELDLQEDIVNVNGGAIALGHPIGASGARILVTLLYEMVRRNVTLGLATLCIGGGMGTSMILERI